MANKRIFIIIAVAVILAAIAAYFYFRRTPVAPVVNVPAAEPVKNAPAAESLGETILNQAKNPVQGKLPDLSPAPNPLQGIYKNPF